MKPPDLPPIDPQLHRHLTEDILRRGILVPILQSEDGEVLDGKLQLAIAQEHGLFCPKIIIGRLSKAERGDLRVAVNIYRRHLNREQFQHLVEWTLCQEPEASDRCIAGRTGIDHKTAGAAWQVGKFPTWSSVTARTARATPPSASRSSLSPATPRPGRRPGS